jgi:hypothetical protein
MNRCCAAACPGGLSPSRGREASCAPKRKIRRAGGSGQPPPSDDQLPWWSAKLERCVPATAAIVMPMIRADASSRTSCLATSESGHGCSAYQSRLDELHATKRDADQSSSIATLRTPSKPAAPSACQPVSRLISHLYRLEVPSGRRTRQWRRPAPSSRVTSQLSRPRTGALRKPPQRRSRDAPTDLFARGRRDSPH